MRLITPLYIGEVKKKWS